ncbi:MAG TPA: serine protease [Caulobacterales bacterium]|nr:serine protease [Caulobacterales bacterium]
MDSISNQLVFNTVRLVAHQPNGHENFGTGFIVAIGDGESTIPLIVTCSHCLSGAISVSLTCVSANKDGTPDLGNVQTWTLDKSLLQLVAPHASLDVVAIPFGPIANQAHAAGKPIFHRQLIASNFVSEEEREKLTALESVVFVGYPLGLYDSKNALPLLRVGSTASPIWSYFEQEPKFLIDAEVFPGSSGSPVFILNEGAYSTPEGLSVGIRFHLVGMITQSLNTSGHAGQHVGLGAVLHANPIREYLLAAAKHLSLHGA